MRIPAKLASTQFAEYALYLAWITALISTIGSLYFSEVAGYAPCMLCWYQRIAIYPLVIILAVGIMLKDSKVWIYALPFAVIGWLISLYHNLLYYGLVEETNATCRDGISCTTEYISWLGFLTIPLLSLIALTVIIAALVFYRKVTHVQRS